MWNILFQNFRFTICFFIYFFIIFNILFSVFSICSCRKILEIFYFFYGLEILSKNFGKSWHVFLKKYSILVIFFSYFTYPSLSKNSKHFWVLYCTDYRFYHRILENSSIFIKKNRDTLNTKHFLAFLAFCFLFHVP